MKSCQDAISEIKNGKRSGPVRPWEKFEAETLDQLVNALASKAAAEKIERESAAAAAPKEEEEDDLPMSPPLPSSQNKKRKMDPPKKQPTLNAFFGLHNLPKFEVDVDENIEREKPAATLSKRLRVIEADEEVGNAVEDIVQGCFFANHVVLVQFMLLPSY